MRPPLLLRLGGSSKLLHKPLRHERVCPGQRLRKGPHRGILARNRSFANHSPHRSILAFRTLYSVARSSEGFLGSHPTYSGEPCRIMKLVRSLEKTICLIRWRRQCSVQTFISGSSMIFVPCCICMHIRAHLFSSAAWHMQRQHKPPRSPVSTGREAPVSDNEARRTMKTAGFLVILRRFTFTASRGIPRTKRRPDPLHFDLLL